MTHFLIGITWISKLENRITKVSLVVFLIIAKSMFQHLGPFKDLHQSQVVSNLKANKK
jgi:hypothetical protein